MKGVLQRHRGLDKEASVSRELEYLRLQLWRARGRHSRRLGSAMLLLSATLLFFAYITSYITFEVTAILALLIGTALLVSHLEPHVKLRPAGRAVLSYIQLFIELKRALSLSGRGVFVPCRAGGARLLLPTEDGVDESTVSKVVDEDVVVGGGGLLLPSPGQSLYQLYEEELGGIRGRDLEYLFEWLPRVMVDGLSLCERVEMVAVGDRIHTALTRPFVRSLCQRSDMRDSICCSIGCPLTASIADTLAVSTGRAVEHVRCRYDPLRLEAYATHSLGGKIGREA